MKILKYISKSILLFIIGILLIVSCSKSEPEPVKPVAIKSPITYFEETFYNLYLSKTGFDQTAVNTIDLANNELGLEFTPIVNGKMTKIFVKLPVVNNNLRVTVWDKAAGTKLTTETVIVDRAEVRITKDIDDLTLVKDRVYAITMNTNDWINRKRTDGGAATYPITIGNLKINGYKYTPGTTAVYPTTVNNTVYSGDIYFNFLQTE